MNLFDSSRMSLEAAREDAERVERLRREFLSRPTERLPSSLSALPTVEQALASAEHTNPFRAGPGFNLTFQSLITKANPGLAASLRAAAEGFSRG